uniref:DUF223 domain-containing protein n=1 Tax=Salix viminalis TaxID=40686 RepID=A0A6N2NJ54_SALVM
MGLRVCGLISGLPQPASSDFARWVRWFDWWLGVARFLAANCVVLLQRFRCLFCVVHATFEIDGGAFEKYQEARVCRVWMPMQNGHASSFNCLLVDHEGGAIQGSSKARDAEFFNINIIEGCYVEIKDFYTYENRAANVVDHEAIIHLKSDTKIVHLDYAKHDVPRYHFNLTDFAHVLTKGRGSRILTAIQPIEKILVQGHRLEDKKEFIIENIRYFHC